MKKLIDRALLVVQRTQSKLTNVEYWLLDKKYPPKKESETSRQIAKVYEADVKQLFERSGSRLKPDDTRRVG